jgi:hypothetical protein
MILLILMLLWVALFTTAAVVDKRWPDRLSRRGRRLAGMPELPVFSAAEGGPCLPPESQRRELGRDRASRITHTTPPQRAALGGLLTTTTGGGNR